MKKWSMKIFGIAVVGVLVCLLGIGQAGAYDQDDLTRLLATNSCNNCNLSGANLAGLDLTRANLGGADLSGANLARVSLTRVNFSGANLSGANLAAAMLPRADLTGADLYRANLSRAMLPWANLSGADLEGADLTGADLAWAIWTDGRQCAEVSIGECVSILERQ